jgi:hypothetical protein
MAATSARARQKVLDQLASDKEVAADHSIQQCRIEWVGHRGRISAVIDSGPNPRHFEATARRIHGRTNRVDPIERLPRLNSAVQICAVLLHEFCGKPRTPLG